MTEKLTHSKLRTCGDCEDYTCNGGAESYCFFPEGGPIVLEGINSGKPWTTPCRFGRLEEISEPVLTHL